jgi:hypothetical protein
VSENNLRDNRENINKDSGIPSNNSACSPNNKEYNSIPQYRFYTEKEEVTLRFYQTPKALFKNPRYRGLSLGSKLMYSILRDRLDMSIENNWKDDNGFIYLIFSIEKLANLLEIDRKAVMRYKKLLVEYKLIIDKRLGQGRSNRIYVLKPELWDTQKSQKGTSRSPKSVLPEVHNKDTNDTYTRKTNLNNVNRAGSKGVVENSKKGIEEKTPENEEDINDIKRKIRESLKEKRKCCFIEPKNSGNDKNIYKESKYSNSSAINISHKPDRYRSSEKKLLAKEISKELEDKHSLGAFRAVADKIPEQQIRIFLSIIKDTYLTGKIKKNRGAMFISLAKAYAAKNYINLNFK